MIFSAVICAAIASVAPYRRFWILYSVPGIIAAAWLLIATFLPLPSTPAGPGGENVLTFTAATYNVKLLLNNETPENAADRWKAIETVDADIIGMQEIAVNVFADYEGIEDLYPYQLFLGTIGLLSRYPLDVENIEKFGIRFGENSLAVFRVEMDVGVDTIAVYVAHFVRPQMRIRPLTYDPSRREYSVDRMIERLETETLPTVLLCDCNMSPYSEAHGRINRVLHDTWAESKHGFGFTTPSDPSDMPVPFMRSDYVWYSDLNLLDVEIISEDGDSDHFPVRATFGVPQSE